MNKLIFLSTVLFCMIPAGLQAQMFTVGGAEERQARHIGAYTTLGAGWEMGDFDFTGNDLPDQDRADFENSILRFRFETPGLHITAGLGGSITGMDERSYTNVNAKLFNYFPLVFSPEFMLSIPVQITTDLKSVQINQSNQSFQQNSLVVGTGFNIKYRIHRRLDFSGGVTPNIGFSFSQGALFGGRLFTTTADTRFYLNDLIGSNSLMIGYNLDYRDYEIEGDQNDYRYFSHSFSIGIAF